MGENKVYCPLEVERAGRDRLGLKLDDDGIDTEIVAFLALD